ncbi:MAG: hypothetical protein J7J17_03330 [Hadesarchaea archaeon]|nr:hypothetical protein [Hadesarchaea archaeon]
MTEMCEITSYIWRALVGDIEDNKGWRATVVEMKRGSGPGHPEHLAESVTAG